MRRRGVGAARSVGSNKKASVVQTKADELKAQNFQTALDTVEKLEGQLTTFAKQHTQDIQRDPAIRQRVLELCALLGIDPLVVATQSKNNKLWGKMADFYHELAVQVAEVCVSTRAQNGGILGLDQVRSRLERRQTRLGTTQKADRKISLNDIKVAIKKLEKLGGGFRTIQVGSSTMVMSVPMELDQDHMTMLAVAENSSGGVQVDDAMKLTGWDRDRVQRSLDLLLQHGMAWLDRYHGIDYYWLPSVWEQKSF